MTRSGAHKKEEVRCVLAATVATIIVCFLELAALSHMMLNEAIAESRTDASVVVIILSAVFIGGQVLRRIEGKRVIDAIITGGIIVGLMILGGLLIDGRIQNMMRNILAVFAGCMLSALHFNKKPRIKRERKKGYR